MAGGEPWSFQQSGAAERHVASDESMVARLKVFGAHVGLNKTTFDEGEALNVTAGLTNPGLPGNVDV